MQNNIFANGVPETVELPFATIKFLPEPNKKDVRSLSDLPTAVLQYVNKDTAQVFSFYLNIQRRNVDGIAYNDMRAANLIRQRVNHAIELFACNFAKMDRIGPHYPLRSYEQTAEQKMKLRENAEEQFFNAVVAQARPDENRFHRGAAGFELGVGRDTAMLGIMLPAALRFTACTENQDSLYYNPSRVAINGTAKLLGRSARVRVEHDFRYLSFDTTMTIADWLPAKVLHEAVFNTLGPLAAEHFGPLGGDLVNRLLTDLVFDLE